MGRRCRRVGHRCDDDARAARAHDGMGIVDAPWPRRHAHAAARSGNCQTVEAGKAAGRAGLGCLRRLEVSGAPRGAAKFVGLFKNHLPDQFGNENAHDARRCAAPYLRRRGVLRRVRPSRGSLHQPQARGLTPLLGGCPTPLGQESGAGLRGSPPLPPAASSVRAPARGSRVRTRAPMRPAWERRPWRHRPRPACCRPTSAGWPAAVATPCRDWGSGCRGW